MVRVLIKTDSHYTIQRKRVRKTIEDFLHDQGVKGNVEVSLAVVGDRKMRQLNREYRKLDKTTNVLAFPIMATELKEPFIEPPDDVLRLGDIVLSYPEVREQAAKEHKLVDDMVDELVIHAMHHLLGKHDYEV